MKKAYEKPEIMFENFTINVNIAADCDIKTGLPTNNTCGMDFSGEMVFLTGMGGCSDTAIDAVGGDGEYNGICYHVMSNGQGLFNS